MEDKRDILRTEEPFDYRELKDNRAQITFKNRVIKTLQGKEYKKLQRVIDLNDSFELQLFMAKITGQFKHGNEKSLKKFN